MASQTAIPCLFMRGGTSRGPFFAAEDLPSDSAARDAVLLAALGSPHPRQIDGLGGGHALTSKVGIVAPGRQAGVDLEFLFAQLQPEKDTVDTRPNCGNMLAAVVPFALERGLIQAQGATTTARVLTLNTGMLADITVQTPGGEVAYEGEARIDGVPGTAAPVEILFLDTAGSVAGSLLPTGNRTDTFELPGFGRLDATCIDNGMPMVLFRAADVGRSGYEGVDALNADEELKALIEALRLAAAEKMGLGDVREKNYPKMCLLAEPKHGGAVHTRCFIPHVCHDAIGVLAAVTVATACVTGGTVAQGLSRNPPLREGKTTLSVEHPGGEFSVALTLDEQQNVSGAALLRTARLIMRGEVMVPKRIWRPETAD